MLQKVDTSFNHNLKYKWKHKTRFIKQQNINIIHHDIDATFFFRCFINLHSPQKSLDTSSAFYCSERSWAQTRGSTSSLDELNEDKRRCSQVTITTTTNSPLWSRKDRRAESCPSDTPSSPSSPSSWPAPPGASSAAATSSRSGTPPSAPRPCSWTRLRSRSGVNIREKYLEELKNIFYLFGFVGRVVDTLGVVILGHCRGEGHPVIVRDLEHGDDEYHENLWCWCCSWCSECILSRRAGVWCWLIMKWLVWVTAGLRLSGTRVKPRLISCLEVACTPI